MGTKTGTILFAAVAAGMAGAVGHSPTASATVIYSDSFVQAQGTQLSGQVVQSSATYAGGTAGAIWTGSTGILTTGSGSYIPQASEIYLPFSPQQGYIYTLSATLDTSSNTAGDWAAIGFSDGAATGAFWHTINSPADWALVRGAASGGAGGGQPQYFAGPGTNNGGGFGTAADTGLQIVVITLNTSAAAWTGSAVIQGDPSNPSSTFTYTSNPAITDVGFGTAGFASALTSANISNFAITAVATPEPASLGLLIAGAAGAMLLLRRRVRTVC